MAQNRVNERSAARLTVDFFDFDDAPSAPTSIDYEVEDLFSGNVLRASTSVTPAASVEIILDKTDTQIVDETNRVEKRCVSILASYGGNDEVNTQFIFDVVNLKGISGTA